VDRLVENIKGNVALELSWGCWLEGNVKWILNDSRERLREGERRFENVTAS